jgi:hypothetical protein
MNGHLRALAALPLGKDSVITIQCEARRNGIQNLRLLGECSVELGVWNERRDMHWRNF